MGSIPNLFNFLNYIDKFQEMFIDFSPFNLYNKLQNDVRTYTAAYIANVLKKG